MNRTKKDKSNGLPPLVGTSTKRHLSKSTPATTSLETSQARATIDRSIRNNAMKINNATGFSATNTHSSFSSPTSSYPTSLSSSTDSSLLPHSSSPGFYFSPRDDCASFFIPPAAAAAAAAAAETTSSPQAKRAMPKLSSEVDDFMCPVCWQSVDKSDPTSVYSFSKCGHTYCKQCVRVQLEIKILNGSAGDLGCMHPGCDTKITDAELEDLVDRKTYEKNIEFARMASIQSNENCRFCPSCSTPGLYSKEEWEGKWPCVECINCGKEMCAECKTSWHANQRCGDTKKTPEQLALEEWAAENFAEFCPKCGALTQKMHGCDWVKCLSCKHEFCFACLEPHNHRSNHKHGDHFDPDKVRRYEQAWGKRHPQKKVVVYSALGVAGVVVGAIIITVSPILILHHVVKTVRKKYTAKEGGREKEEQKTEDS